MAHDEKLSELQIRLRQLIDQVEQITKEQNYQRVSVELILRTGEEKSCCHI